MTLADARRLVAMDPLGESADLDKEGDEEEEGNSGSSGDESEGEEEGDVGGGPLIEEDEEGDDDGDDGVVAKKKKRRRRRRLSGGGGVSPSGDQLSALGGGRHHPPAPPAESDAPPENDLVALARRSGNARMTVRASSGAASPSKASLRRPRHAGGDVRPFTPSGTVVAPRRWPMMLVLRRLRTEPVFRVKFVRMIESAMFEKFTIESIELRWRRKRCIAYFTRWKDQYVADRCHL